MLLHRIIDHDIHGTKDGVAACPLILETPAKSHFVPAIVSTTDPGRFLVARRLTREGRLRSAVFSQDPDRLDDLVRPLMRAALALSVSEKFPNRFSKASDAFDYIARTSGTGAHPHIVLIPSDWSGSQVDKLLGSTDVSDKNGNVYKRICRVIPSTVETPVFLSRPDFVGMYTQFLGGRGSLFLHNVKEGMAFVVPRTKNAASRQVSGMGA